MIACEAVEAPVPPKPIAIVDAFQVPIVNVPTEVKDEKPTVTGSVVPVSVLAFAVTVAEEPKATDVPFISTDELTS